MPTCSDCRFLVQNAKGGPYRCVGKRCGVSRVTPETDASKCLKFMKK